VAVDSSSVYRANYRTGEIGRANLDGSGANPNFISTGAAPEIALDSRYIYWTNNNGTNIGRASLDGTGVKPNFITGVRTGNVGIAVDSTHIYWANWSNGSGTTIGGAAIDGTAVNNDFITGGSGPYGMAVPG
jgi:virginiamycin B lyase